MYCLFGLVVVLPLGGSCRARLPRQDGSGGLWLLEHRLAYQIGAVDADAYE